jgi:GT2 family glycosyltransferase
LLILQKTKEFNFGKRDDSLNAVPSLRIHKEFTVIIPTVGRPILRDCLDAIINGRVLPARIIVVDQGNNLEVAKWLQVVGSKGGIDTLHIRSPGRSPSSARNEGIEQVNTPFFVAIDDDCLADVDWLEMFDKRLHENPGCIVTGRVEAAGDGVPQTVVTLTTPYIMSHLPIDNFSPLSTGNMGVSWEVAQRIGKFDENLFTAEDTDWAYRGFQIGIPIYYTPDVIVYHHHWRDRHQTSTNYLEYAKGLGAFFGKHLRLKEWSMIPRALLALFRGAKSFLKGWINHDQDLSQDGYARLTKLIPGLIIGLFRFDKGRKG